MIRGRTRQITAFARKHGRLPADVFELGGVPRVPRMLILAAVDRQQATLQRSETVPARVLLRLQLPTRPDPRSDADWHWVACPLSLPPAAETGIAVVTVPARDSSKLCPQCLTPLRHRAAPDRPATPGWKWAICPNPGCGWQGDRDQGAWQRIAARGLTHQDNTVMTDRGRRRRPLSEMDVR